ncbi:carcinoembryonic antigen-related cell adhesion molecule 5-like [Neoarius graeffei]|uniref:carcinoembryonic antigen-related cell adhesion molecule 5-like n=1 Tax=Neoarius graeffei TaxID=443677 RepID=UPI00298C6D4F|nr:carcinoembryonic antigen-related cell adhesion molecule 5-like [Neoarius graeffei]
MLLLVSLTTVADAQGSPKAVVSIKPDIHMFIGEHVTLRCNIDAQGDTQWPYSWFKNNTRLNQYRDSVVYAIGYSDRGSYTCSGSFSEISDPVTMTVSERPKATVRVNPQSSVYTGDTITLSCELQQGTGWEFLWYKNNQYLQHLNTGATDTSNLSVMVDTAGETGYQCGAHRRNTWANTDYYTDYSNRVRITARERPPPVLSVSPQSWLTEGNSVTLSCEVTGFSTDWIFSWYTTVPYRDGLTQIRNNHGYNMYLEPLPDSSRESGGKYTLSPAALNHTGVYMCRGKRGEPAFHTQYSNPQPLWITASESPPVSLIIHPNRTQHFTYESLLLSCNSTDQSNFTGWTVRRYAHSERVLDCLWWGSVTGSTCEISPLSTLDTGVYWCHSESGENRNPVNITVQNALVILESPVHPVTEGHPLTLRCLYRNPKPSNLRADFYRDESVLQTQTTGEMIIHNISKSDEGFYHCKYPEGEESLKSWVSVRHEKPFPGFRSSGGTVGVAVGLGFLFISLLILMILLWSYKRKKEKQQKNNQTSEQNQRQSGAEDSQSGYTALQAGQTLS